MGVTYIVTAALALVAFYFLDATYERQKDTCSLSIILFPCIIATLAFQHGQNIFTILWTLSQFIEGFAMVPQYIFCYRDHTSTDLGVTFYVMALGGYRMFYAANWIYKKVRLGSYYSDFQSWISGLIEISFFIDYLLARFTGFSVLRAFVLTVDQSVNEMKDKVTGTVLRRQSDQTLE